MLRAPSQRRPRVQPRAMCTRCMRTKTAYVVPPLAAAGVLAIVSVSMLTLKNLIEARKNSSKPFRLQLPSLASIRHNLSQVLSRRVAKPGPPPPETSDPFRRLEAIRDCAIAQLESERITAAAVVPDEEYGTLPALQRRELLASALEASYKRPVSAPVANAAQKDGVGGASTSRSSSKVETVKNDTKMSSFWKVAESVNGRAAALGFMLCLAREVLEPGHPSLFEQVEDVVVPIAQSTPPFLVAVCDHLVDLLT